MKITEDYAIRAKCTRIYSVWFPLQQSKIDKILERDWIESFVEKVLKESRENPPIGLMFDGLDSNKIRYETIKELFSKMYSSINSGSIILIKNSISKSIRQFFIRAAKECGIK